MNRPEKEKENFPPAPPIEKKEKALKATFPFPFKGEGEGTGEGEGRQSLQKGEGEVAFRPCGFKGKGEAPRRKVRVDARFILNGDMGGGRRNDPVQMAMVALRIPKTVATPDGRTYNNARIMRKFLQAIGEEAFRETVYRQWRENEVDGYPRSTAAAFMAKLNRLAYGGEDGDEGGAA